MGRARLPARAVPRQLQLAARSIPFPLAAARSAPSSRKFYERPARRSCATKVDSRRHRRDRRVPRARGRRPAQARRLRHEDPEGVRRARLHGVASTARSMELVGSYDGNISALLSAHQSIGVPQPLKLFGTPEQKKKYLPRCAAGRDLGVRAHRAARRLRSGEPVDHRRAATATTSSSTARSSGAPTARSPSCWW